ncbi:hypothetical protein F030043B2_05710 [Bacteroides fragilis]
MIKPEYLTEKVRKFAYKYPIYVFYSSIRKISKKDRVIKREIKISFSCKNANKQIYLHNPFPLRTRDKIYPYNQKTWIRL